MKQFKKTAILMLFSIILLSLKTPIGKPFQGGSGHWSRLSSCPEDRNITYMHDGFYAKPKVGDIIYMDLACTQVLDGGGKWYKIAIRKTAKVNSNGVVTEIYICQPGEY